jgi:hypothetical protein
MFINMGKNYNLNTDGYVYALSIDHEGPGDLTQNQAVYLARVPVEAITDYNKYEYFAGLDMQSQPKWSDLQTDTVSVPGIVTAVKGAALYHAGIKRYLFLSGLNDFTGQETDQKAVKGILFEAENPWGPWLNVATFQGGFIPGLIAKDAGAAHVYFTAAGGTKTYNLNVGRIDFELRP